MDVGRLTLSVAVIGAVAVGGAVTGTTMARWTDHSTLEQVSLSSGRIALGVTAGGRPAEAALVLPAMADLDAPRAVEFSVVNTGAGRNLRVAVTADVSARRADGTPAPLGFHVTALAAGATCSPAARGALVPSITGAPLAPASAPGQTTRVCLTVGLGTATAVTESYSVAATIRGVQVRGLP